MKPHFVILVPALLICVFTALAAQPTAQAQSVREIKLGSVTVRGEKAVQVLQAIKVALRQPNSADPKLANVVVCRIHDALGSHVQQVLTCATNNTLNRRRDRVELDMKLPGHTWGEILDNQPGQELNVPLAGNSFRNLLDTIPMPALAETIVHVATVSSNLLTGHGQGEVLQLGNIKVTGAPMIQEVLQAVKAGLQQPYTNSPQSAELVVCRENAESDNTTDHVLICATNDIWSNAQGSLRAIKTAAYAPPTATYCRPSVVAQFSTALDALPEHYLQISVDGVRLHELLGTVHNACSTSTPTDPGLVP